MISLENRLKNQLLKTVRVDMKDHSVIRIDMDNAVKIFYDYNYLIPVKPFEAKLSEILNRHFVGTTLVEGLTIHRIVETMVKLANEIAIDEEDIIKFLSENQSPEDVAFTQKKIDDWRREYYGKMPRDQREALVEALHDRLRPEILEKIRNAK